MKHIILLLLLIVPQAQGVPMRSDDLRTVSGVIYFTNNTPRDVQSFPIELLTPDEKKVIAATTPDAHHNFSIRDVAPGEYLLKITRPNICTLRYRVDVRTESKTRIRVVMDAACAHDNGAIRDLEDN